MADLILIRGAEVFTPEARGVLDVLIAGNRVAALGPTSTLLRAAGPAKSSMRMD